MKRLFLPFVFWSSFAFGAGYQPVDHALRDAFSLSKASLDFSQFRWEREVSAVSSTFNGVAVEIGAVSVFAPDIEIVDDVAVVKGSAYLNSLGVSGRSLTRYDSVCQLGKLDVIIRDHLKSTALMLAGGQSISVRGMLKEAVIDDNCVTRIVMDLHTWSPSTVSLVETTSTTSTTSNKNKEIMLARTPPPTGAFVGKQGQAPAEFQPARFASGQQALERLIKFPAGSVDMTVVVLCDALATKRGKLTKLRCRGEQENQFVDSIVRAAPEAILIPAMVSNKRKKVSFPFSVSFERLAGQETIRAYPNHGNSAAEFGTDYSAPQRYVTGTHSTCGLDMLWQTLEIDGSGLVRQTAIDDVPGLEDCLQKVRTRRKSDRYIPAMAGDTRFSARYVEVYTYW